MSEEEANMEAVPFANKMSARIAAVENLDVKLKLACGHLVKLVLMADAPTLPPEILKQRDLVLDYEKEILSLHGVKDDSAST